jgi:hypothetical protein
MRTLSQILGTASILGAVASPLFGQPTHDRIGVLRAVAADVKSAFAGTVAVDPRHAGGALAQSQAAASSQHDAPTLAALAAILRGGIAQSNEVVQCPGRTPDTCRLRDVAAVVAFGDPVFAGDSVTVFVSMKFAGDSPRMPVVASDKTIVLVRKGGAWTIVRKQVDRIT